MWRPHLSVNQHAVHTRAGYAVRTPSMRLTPSPCTKWAMAVQSRGRTHGFGTIKEVQSEVQSKLFMYVFRRYTDYEADAMSMHLMAKAGFNPAAVPSLLGWWAEEHQKQQQVRLMPTGSPPPWAGLICWRSSEAMVCNTAGVPSPRTTLLAVCIYCPYRVPLHYCSPFTQTTNHKPHHQSRGTHSCRCTVALRHTLTRSHSPHHHISVITDAGGGLQQLGPAEEPDGHPPSSTVQPC